MYTQPSEWNLTYFLLILEMLLFWASVLGLYWSILLHMRGRQVAAINWAENSYLALGILLIAAALQSFGAIESWFGRFWTTVNLFIFGPALITGAVDAVVYSARTTLIYILVACALGLGLISLRPSR